MGLGDLSYSSHRAFLSAKEACTSVEGKCPYVLRASRNRGHAAGHPLGHGWHVCGFEGLQTLP